MSHLDFIDVPQPLERRIHLASQSIDLDPNCFGTAFFLLGFLPYDMVLFTNKGFISRGLSLLKEVPEPKDNSLIVSLRNGKSIEHMSYVKSVNPFEAYQRRGASGNLELVNDMNQIQDYLESISGFQIFHKVNWTHKYYSLPNLGKITNFFHKKKLNSWSKEIVNLYEPCWWG